MSPETAPDYRTTSRRPEWGSLPREVRNWAAAAAGGAVDGVRPVGGGFTHGFAAVLDGPRPVFLKAGRVDDPVTGPGYAREARVLEALPEGLPVPRLLDAALVQTDAGPWQLLATRPIPGHMPGHPWTTGEAAAVHAACLALNEGLAADTGLPARLGLEPMAAQWSTGAGGAELGRAARTWLDPAARPAFLPAWFAADDAAGALVELLDRVGDALAGSTPLNNDLRADNVVLASASVDGHPAGTAWVCDWNWLSTGPAWADWAAVLPYLHHAGLDVAAMAEWELLAGADPDDVDAWLALLTVYYAESGAQPEVPTSPVLRRHARFSAAATLGLLAARRGWHGRSVPGVSGH
ncbi:phosphotransferase family protein [Zafaria sp. Z1313]|uniref:phosphotransferase family protein n=1 Tax=Zafaria sp. Z1313 TaxID=3423202 RepID=UPI003D30320F